MKSFKNIKKYNSTVKSNNLTRGITLIALVITVIVLLILAGVAIATLLGDNGIITRATTAKEKTQQAGAVERVQMEVQGSYGTDGLLDYKELQKNLNNVQGIDKSTIPDKIEDTSFPIKVTVDGTDVEIKENGEVKLAFNAKEWDKTACKEDSFLWESDNPEDGEAYHTIVGYADNMENEVIFKVPSRCHKITCQNSNWDNRGRNFTKKTFDTVYIPNTVTEIGYYAFDSFCFTSIVIPNSVTSIEDWAFHSCTGLTNIKIPNSVTSIGFGAFNNCTDLTKITIPDSVTNIGINGFGWCTSLTEITIPDSVTSIGRYAFSNCTGLTEITIPDSVTSIGNYAFLRLYRLNEYNNPRQCNKHRSLCV